MNYPAFIDGDATVDENRRRITYADPEAEFLLSALADGGFALTDTLRVRRELSADVMTAFIAPEFDDGAFTYHVFANDSFVEDADWNVLTVEDRDPTSERRVTFDELHDGVSHFAVTPERESNAVVVTDADRETYQAPESEPTVVGIAHGRRTEPAEVPDVSFDFEYGTETDPTVEITHTGGDSLEGDRIVVHLDGRRISNPFAVESVTRGETAVIGDVTEGPDFSSHIITEILRGTSSLRRRSGGDPTYILHGVLTPDAGLRIPALEYRRPLLETIENGEIDPSFVSTHQSAETVPRWTRRATTRTTVPRS